MTIHIPSMTQLVFSAALLLAATAPALAQSTAPQKPTTGAETTAGAQPGAVSQPTSASQPAPAPQPGPGTQSAPDYVIGVDDVLSVVFWREKELTADVTVRPDGMISLALLNDVRAAGLTALQLRASIMEAARKFVTDPNVTVTVKTINSRKVYVAGLVNKPGTYSMTEPMTVLQVLAVAGGLAEFVSGDNILIMRTENGQTKSMKFNYKDVRKGKNLEQNILLEPGDTIVVP